MSTTSTRHSQKSMMVRYAEQLAESSRRGSSDVGSPAVILVSLMEESVSQNYKFRSYSCSVPSGKSSPHKVIMLVGATGAGKSTIINAMINHIMGVKWEANFRFKLVDERREASGSQAHSKTQNITSYTIHNSDHINVPYKLTIIDTPGIGDARGIDHDRTIAEQIKEFLSHPDIHSVDHIDAVCLVVQSPQARLDQTQTYIFESLISVFGKDIEPNILLLTTFCDDSPPKVLDAVKEAKLPFDTFFKFNNSATFASRERNIEAAFWCMGYKSTNELFDALDHLQPQRLNLTVEVLEERRCLEIALKGLQPQIQIACALMKRLNRDKQMLEVHEKQIEENKCFEYEADVAKLELNRDEKQGSTNCPKCLYTCHYPCTSSRAKIWCHAMSRGKCTVCPNKCSWSEHVHEHFTYHWKMVPEKRTYADIENRYRDAIGHKQTCEEVIKRVEADLCIIETAVSELIKESHRCTQRLDVIALKPNPMGIIDYIGILIETEKVTKGRGWQERVGSLKATIQRENTKAVVQESAVSGNLFESYWNTVTQPFMKT